MWIALVCALIVAVDAVVVNNGDGTHKNNFGGGGASTLGNFINPGSAYSHVMSSAGGFSGFYDHGQGGSSSGHSNTVIHQAPVQASMSSGFPAAALGSQTTRHYSDSANYNWPLSNQGSQHVVKEVTEPTEESGKSSGNEQDPVNYFESYKTGTKHSSLIPSGSSSSNLGYFPKFSKSLGYSTNFNQGSNSGHSSKLGYSALTNTGIGQSIKFTSPGLSKPGVGQGLNSGYNKMQLLKQGYSLDHVSTISNSGFKPSKTSSSYVTDTDVKSDSSGGFAHGSSFATGSSNFKFGTDHKLTFGNTGVRHGYSIGPSATGSNLLASGYGSKFNTGSNSLTNHIGASSSVVGHGTTSSTVSGADSSLGYTSNSGVGVTSGLEHGTGLISSNSGYGTITTNNLNSGHISTPGLQQSSTISGLSLTRTLDPASVEVGHNSGSGYVTVDASKLSPMSIMVNPNLVHATTDGNGYYFSAMKGSKYGSISGISSLSHGHNQGHSLSGTSNKDGMYFSAMGKHPTVSNSNNGFNFGSVHPVKEIADLSHDSTIRVGSGSNVQGHASLIGSGNSAQGHKSAIGSGSVYSEHNSNLGQVSDNSHTRYNSGSGNAGSVQNFNTGHENGHNTPQFNTGSGYRPAFPETSRGPQNSQFNAGSAFNTDSRVVQNPYSGSGNSGGPGSRGNSFTHNSYLGSGNSGASGLHGHSFTHNSDIVVGSGSVNVGVRQNNPAIHSGVASANSHQNTGSGSYGVTVGPSNIGAVRVVNSPALESHAHNQNSNIPSRSVNYHGERNSGFRPSPEINPVASATTPAYRNVESSSQQSFTARPGVHRGRDQGFALSRHPTNMNSEIPGPISNPPDIEIPTNVREMGKKARASGVATSTSNFISGNGGSNGLGMVTVIREEPK